MSFGKRFLCVLPNLRGGGAERVAIELMRGLRESDIRMDLLLFKDQVEYDLPSIPDRRIIALLQDNEKIGRKLPSFVTRFFRTVRDYDVLVGGLEFWPSYLVSIAGKLMHKQVIWLNHTCLSSYIRENGIPGYHRQLTRHLSRYAERVVAVSNGAKEDLVDEFAIDAEKIEVIYNPNDLESIRAASLEPISTYEERFFERPSVISAGKISRLKGYDLLLSAVKSVHDRGVDCNLILLGSGPDSDDFTQTASDLGIADRVFMPGFKKNPYKYIARATAFVLPSRIEGFGNVLIEAMACGCPVVTTDCKSGPEEIVGGGKYGSLVKTGDVDGMADAIERLITDAVEHKRLSELGLQRATAFDASIAVKRYSEVFVSI